MYTHLYSLPSAVETPDDELDAPVPPIEAVLFDFANTLFRMVPTDVFLLRVWQAAGRDVAELDIESLVREVRAAGLLPHVQAAQVGRDLDVQRHREATRVWFGEVPQLAGIVDLAYEAVLAQENWFPYTDTAPVLRALERRGIPVGVVSNIVWDVRRDLEAAGVGDAVRAYALSYQLNCEKPDPRLFLKACADLGADPRRTVMVGDNPAQDGGAVACGLRALILPAEPRTGDRGLDSVLRLLG
ncbi:HAD-IA family hydrolase [Actinocrinis sp.]|uniref:HAD family hydrolase n=1 Tax=Actinocrinis sp. TaxID=1920516 RepID=UPI002D7390C6|nr:HAD-IA family hydrolase [Actinocrinis sp.]HZP50214.1 HAD-IA family hydrolase [Actinocrinis sp.]